VPTDRVKSVQAHGAGRGRPEPEQGLHQRGLARAVGAEQRDDLAVAHVQRHIVHGAQLAEVDFEMLNLDGVTHA